MLETWRCAQNMFSLKLYIQIFSDQSFKQFFFSEVRRSIFCFLNKPREDFLRFCRNRQTILSPFFFSSIFLLPWKLSESYCWLCLYKIKKSTSELSFFSQLICNSLFFWGICVVFFLQQKKKTLFFFVLPLTLFFNFFNLNYL